MLFLVLRRNDQALRHDRHDFHPLRSHPGLERRQSSAGGSLRVRSPDPDQTASMKEWDARDTALSQAPKAAQRQGPIPQTAFYSDSGFHEVTKVGMGHATSGPGPGQWAALMRALEPCRTQPSACFLGHPVHPPVLGRVSPGRSQDPSLTPLSLRTTTLPTVDWRGHQQLLTDSCLWEGPAVVLTNDWAGPLTVAHWQLVACGRGHCGTNQWLSRATKGTGLWGNSQQQWLHSTGLCYKLTKTEGSKPLPHYFKRERETPVSPRTTSFLNVFSSEQAIYVTSKQ